MTVLGAINQKWELQLTPDREMFHRERPTWEATRLSHLHDRAHPGDVVYDVGAECGDFTALYRTWGCVVIPVEPQPAYWPAIRAHYTANAAEPFPPAGFVGFAAGSTNLLPPACDIEGPLALAGGAWPPCADGPIIPDYGFRHLAQQADSTPRIELDNLAGYATVSTVEPDVITIDVEGAEWDVLRGCRRLLANKRPLVYVSASPETMREWYGRDDGDVHALMKAYEYEPTLLGVEHEEFWFYEPVEQT